MSTATVIVYPQCQELLNIDPVELDQYLSSSLDSTSSRKRKMYELNENDVENKDQAEKIKAAKRQKRIRNEKKQLMAELKNDIEKAKMEIEKLRLDIATENNRKQELERVMKLYESLQKYHR